MTEREQFEALKAAYDQVNSARHTEFDDFAEGWDAALKWQAARAAAPAEPTRSAEPVAWLMGNGDLYRYHPQEYGRGDENFTPLYASPSAEWLAENDRLRSLLQAVLSCDDLTGWCGPVASPLYDRIDAELCSPSPK